MKSISPAHWKEMTLVTLPSCICSHTGRDSVWLACHDVPVTWLGRMAVDRSMQRQGLGGQLLLAAGRRCLRASQEVGGIALLIDAKNEDVASWYASYGALPLLDAPLSLLLPLTTFKAALEATGKL